MDWRAFMCPEQSTPLITAHSSLTSNSLIISNEERSASVWRVGATKWLPSSNKICPLWLDYASKMLQRLKYCVSPGWWYCTSSHQFHCYLHRIQWKVYQVATFDVWKWHFGCLRNKTAETLSMLSHTVIMLNKINIQPQLLWISCIINGVSQSDH